MRFCIFGVGAVGGLLLARMARAGLSVTGVARGETLAAIRARGIRIVDENGDDEEPSRKVNITEDIASLGPQDVVIVAMKANTVARSLRHMAPLIGPDTIVIPAVNGIPWWYFHGLPGNWTNPHLDMVDPGGTIWSALQPQRTLGCVVYLGASVPSPGVIHRTRHELLVFGEPDGSMSDRLNAVAGAMGEAQFDARAVPDIRTAVWHKVWGNAWANAMSILTSATIDRICDDESLRQPLHTMMAEIRDVAHAYGVDLDGSIEERVAQSATLGAFRSSTLQDWDRRRPIEIDAILGALVEMGKRGGVSTPAVDMVYGLSRLAADVSGRYQPPGA